MEVQKITKAVKHYIVDVTALLVHSTPLYAFMETSFSKMDSSTSSEVRIKAALLGYAGLGFVFTKGRDLSRKLLKINQTSSEKSQIIHDALYNIAFNIGISVPIYVSSGADLKQTVYGTLGAVGLASISGPLSGYSVDFFRDAFDIKPFERFGNTSKNKKLEPNLTEKVAKLIKNTKPITKKLIIAMAIAGSLALTSEIYDRMDRNNNNLSNQEQEISLETKIYSIYKNS